LRSHLLRELRFVGSPPERRGILWGRGGSDISAELRRFATAGRVVVKLDAGVPEIGVGQIASVERAGVWYARRELRETRWSSVCRDSSVYCARNSFLLGELGIIIFSLHLLFGKPHLA
jgi:hypothetical protein